MKLTLFVPLALLTLLTPAFAQPAPPALTRPVNDFAHVIDQASADAMDKDIRALEAATGDTVVVATVDTFAPFATIDEYAVQMFENQGRGVGQKGNDNAVLLLVAVKDRRDRIEVGYGLEPFLTDGFTGETRRTYMEPAFARGEYGRGLLEGVHQVIGRIAQGRGVTITGIAQPAAPGGSVSAISPALIIFFIILFVLIVRANRRAVGPRSRWGRGPWSGWNSGVGPFGGGGGFGGGGFGGGFGGFGGGSGGGFGGFGGGRSGGGGSSGGW